MSVVNSVIAILKQVLGLGHQRDLTPDSMLLGAVPELDSMAVVSVLTALEDRYDISIEDDEMDASVFESVASLIAFVEMKRNESG